MTTEAIYFRDVFPAHLVLRLVRGGAISSSSSRHLALSRPGTPGDSGWRHFPAASIQTPAALRTLLLYKHKKDEETGNAILIHPPFSWKFTTLHLGWLCLEHLPLVSGHDPGRQEHLDCNEFELAFDFDLPEIDSRPRHKEFPIRGGFLCDCAMTKAGCCRRCWLLIRLVRRTLTSLVPANWGPGLWVYSGGKGAHCIYGSAEARTFPLELRKAFELDFSEMVNEKKKIPDALVDLLYAAWEELGVRQEKVLASDLACRILAEAFFEPTSPERAKFLKVLSLTRDSAMRWAVFVRTAGVGAARRVACELGLFPVDKGPLTNRRGRIKCPFSLHTTSRRVALPLTDAQFESFDPSQALSLNALPHVMKQAMEASVTHVEAWLNANGYASI